MRTFRLYRNGEVIGWASMHDDKTVTRRMLASGDDVRYASLATLLIHDVRYTNEALVEVDSDLQEGQRWEGQEERAVWGMTEQEYMAHLETAYNLLIGAEDAYSDDDDLHRAWREWTDKTAGMLLKWKDEQDRQKAK